MIREFCSDLAHYLGNKDCYMGKPFKEELENLGENVSFALSYPIDALRCHLGKAMATGSLLLCGAGGSFSAAAFLQLVLENSRVDVRCVTPLHFLQMPKPIKKISLILFSAAGRNKDVLRVIDRALRLEIPVTLICSSKGSPASEAVRCEPANTVFEFTYPFKKDGFLAVNSLVVTWWMIARALAYKPPTAEEVLRLAETDFDVSAFDKSRRHTCLILHDFWTRPIALDLESKMAEAALCSPIVSDWRQFGHGRHNWLAKNGNFTTVLALRNLENTELINKTLELIPEKISRLNISSDVVGVTGVCKALIKSFAFIGCLGRHVGIDPGRPGVPAYGSALYRLSIKAPSKAKVGKDWDLANAVSRKEYALAVWQFPSIKKVLVEHSQKYLDQIMAQHYGAVVLDFDGTIAKSGLSPTATLGADIVKVVSNLLRNNILIGVATGRGDSCHENLTKAFDEKYWDKIFISHYNGATISTLLDLMSQPIEWDEDPSLKTIAAELNTHPILTEISSIHFKGPQITLRVKENINREVVEQIIRTMIGKSHSKYARVVTSSHTLDIVPITATKSKLVNYLKNKIGVAQKVLTIGDRGDIYGNDFELLTHNFSLSVDCVSSDMNSCWNFLPEGISHEAGTVWYLSRARASKATFHLT